MIVYALIDPRDNRVRYVGKSHRTAHRRLRRHLAPCYLTGNTHKERWLRVLLKVGIEPKIEVLARCATPTALVELERSFIAAFRAVLPDLTNASDGGDGGSGPHTPESREKIRRALTGKPKSEQHRLRTIAAITGRRASEATKEKLRASHRRPRGSHTPERCINMARGRGCGPIVDQHGNRYETQASAARLLKINVGHLSEVLRGKRRHVSGYTFTRVPPALLQ